MVRKLNENLKLNKYGCSEIYIRRLFFDYFYVM